MRLVGALLPAAVDLGAQPELGVFVRDDLRAGFSQRFVRSGVLRMPAGVEQHLYRLAARLLGHQLQQFGGSLGGAAVHQQDAVRTENRQNIAARARDQKEGVGELGDFQGRLPEGTMSESYAGRATGKAPQEPTTI